MLYNQTKKKGIEKGRVKGKEKGEEKGREKGRKKAKDWLNKWLKRLKIYFVLHFKTLKEGIKSTKLL